MSNEAAERLRDRIPPWDGIRQEFDEALAAEHRATVERIRERMEAEYTVHYGRGVCLSLLSQVLDEEAQR